MKGLLFLLSAASVIAFNVAQTQLTICGHIVCSGSFASMRINPTFTVALQDISVADAPAIVIATSVGRANRFPIYFEIDYTPSQVTDGTSFSLYATIRNQDRNNQLLYTTNVIVPVTPLGINRTETMDVPVISVSRK